MPKLAILNEQEKVAFIYEGTADEVVQFLKVSGDAFGSKSEPKVETTIEAPKPMFAMNEVKNQSAKALIDKIQEQIEADLRNIGKRTPLVSRRKVIEQAKADVERLKDAKTSNYIPKADGGCDRVYFITNRSARTVKAIIRCDQMGEIRNAIARCEPGDVFNVHIGRAIALHRALGLPVPAVYLKAPQPTTAEVGDIVLYGARKYTLVANSSEVNFGESAMVKSTIGRNGRIVDDSK